MSYAPRFAVCLASAAALLSALIYGPNAAKACGCFTPPGPSVPIVQAGERIAFYVADGKVTSHVQIQYSGPAEEFGWLLPLPSVPDVGLSTPELFPALLQSTQPSYQTTTQLHGDCFSDIPAPESDDTGGAGGDPDSPPSPQDPGSDGPLVIEDSVGPFDFAVLRADSKQPMLEWLDDNGYFVPAGTDEAVDPYIREGAFFLALRLRKGEDVGDLQPVKVTYEADLPMIPIVLTSVAADPDMAVQVWVLGEDRAIPRNFRHTEINDARIDWLRAGQNYESVVTEAVDEADGHHSFVTEYAGTSSVMDGRLGGLTRFGDPRVLETITDAVEYVDYLRLTGFWFDLQNANPNITAALREELPITQALLDFGITEPDYYFNFRFYHEQFIEQFPELFVDVDLEYDPVALTAQLEERVIVPTREAAAVFDDYPYLTRLFTTLSPEEMTKDPVFSFNPDLADVSPVHDAVLDVFCDGEFGPINTQLARLTTEQGRELWFPEGTRNNPWESLLMPGSLAIEILGEEGAAQSEVDNDALIQQLIDAENQRLCDDGGCDLPEGVDMPDGRGSPNADGGCGCRTSEGTGPTALLLVAAVGLMLRRRRRP